MTARGEGAAVAARGLRAARHGRPVLHGVDLTVAPGEFVLLAGASGGGKSTLLHALAGLLHHAPGATVEGRARVAGLDPLTAPPRRLAARVGVVFQRAEDQLLSLDAQGEVEFKLQNLGATRRQAQEGARRALESVGAAHLAGRDTHALSGGEAKRVALATALATHHAPGGGEGGERVLLLDEPLSHLDPPARARLLDALAGLTPRVTVVCATHRVDALRPLATRVLHLHDGRLTPAPLPAPEAPRFHGAPATGAAVRLHGVAAGPGDAPVLRDVTLHLQGGLVAVAGPNGAGKSTLLKVVAGLLPPREGAVRIGGRDAAALSPRARAARVGYAPQDPAALFLAPTTREELAYGPRNLGAPVDVDGLAASHGLRGLLHRHPHALSGGERERLAWAAAHAHAPPVRCYDEPTTGLDAAARQALHAQLAEARATGLALVATHDAALLQAADRVILLSGGRVVSDGPPRHALAPGRLRRLAEAHPGLDAFALPRAAQRRVAA